MSFKWVFWLFFGITTYFIFSEGAAFGLSEEKLKVAFLLFASSLLVVVQLIMGRALGGDWQFSVSRKEQPGRYWILVVIELLFALTVSFAFLP